MQGQWRLHIKSFGLQWVAFAVLLGAVVVSSRGALIPMLGGMARFAVPFIIFWFIFKFIKSRIIFAVRRFDPQTINFHMNQSTNSNMGQNGQLTTRRPTPNIDNGSQILDLCPKCGDLQSPKHRC